MERVRGGGGEPRWSEWLWQQQQQYQRKHTKHNWETNNRWFSDAFFLHISEARWVAVVNESVVGRCHTFIALVTGRVAKVSRGQLRAYVGHSATFHEWIWCLKIPERNGNCQSVRKLPNGAHAKMSESILGASWRACHSSHFGAESIIRLSHIALSLAIEWNQFLATSTLAGSFHRRAYCKLEHFRVFCSFHSRLTKTTEWNIITRDGIP